MSTVKVGSERVPENGLGEYRKGGIWASTGKVESRRVPERGPSEYQKGGIQASTEEGSGRVPE